MTVSVVGAGAEAIEAYRRAAVAIAAAPTPVDEAPEPLPPLPSVYRQGKRVSVRLRLESGDDHAIDLAAHEKVPVRRAAT